MHHCISMLQFTDANTALWCTSLEKIAKIYSHVGGHARNGTKMKPYSEPGLNNKLAREL